MRNAEKIVLVLLCFATIEYEVRCDKLKKFNSRANSLGIKSSRLETDISQVSVGDLLFDIYFYDPASEADKTHLSTSQFKFWNNTLAKFHTCMCCTFGLWTRDKLIEFVKVYPQFYQPEMMYVFDDDLTGKDPGHLLRLKRISKYTEIFANILFGFTNAIGYDDSSSVNSIVLKSLLSLNFKIDYLMTSFADSQKEYGSDDVKPTDVRIIQMVLQVINSIQNFILLHCKVPSFGAKMYDFMLTYGLDRLNNDTDVETFLNVTHQLKLESMVCDRKRYLLLDIGSLNFDSVVWKIEEIGVKPAQITRRMNKTYDLDIIFWYQEMVSKTIVKFLVHKISNRTRNATGLTDRSVENIATVYREVLTGFPNLPNHVHDFFTLVIEKRLPDDFWYDARQKLKNKINEYVSTTLKDVDIGNASDDDGSALEDFTDKILTMVDDFKCFNRLFGFLHGEYDMYYVPYNQDPAKIDAFVRETAGKPTEEMEDTRQRETRLAVECDYIIRISQMCFEATLTANRAMSDPEGGDLWQNIWKNVNSVQRLLNILQHISDVNNRVQKTVYRIIALIDVINFRDFPEYLGDESSPQRPGLYDDLKRVLYVIMTELNGHGLEFCTPPDYGFSLFSNIRFDSLPEMQSTIDLSSPVGIRQCESSGETSRFNGVHQFYNDIGKMSRQLDWYGDIILFKWQGQEENFGYIFVNLLTTVESPVRLFSMYDYYFKHSVAQLYHEVYILNNITNTDEKLEELECQKFISIKKKMPKIHPSRFTEILRDIFVCLDLFLIKVCARSYEVSEIDEVNLRILTKFDQMGMSVNSESAVRKQNALASNVKSVSNRIQELCRSTENIFGYAMEILRTQNPSWTTKNFHMFNEV